MGTVHHLQLEELLAHKCLQRPEQHQPLQGRQPLMASTVTVALRRWQGLLLLRPTAAASSGDAVGATTIVSFSSGSTLLRIGTLLVLTTGLLVPERLVVESLLVALKTIVVMAVLDGATREKLSRRNAG
jgi:hypothetical protein